MRNDDLWKSYPIKLYSARNKRIINCPDWLYITVYFYNTKTQSQHLYSSISYWFFHPFHLSYCSVPIACFSFQTSTMLHVIDMNKCEKSFFPLLLFSSYILYWWIFEWTYLIVDILYGKMDIYMSHNKVSLCPCQTTIKYKYRWVLGRLEVFTYLLNRSILVSLECVWRVLMKSC